MTIISKTSFFIKTLRSLPLILLFFSVLNQGDFNYLNVKYFSFNFPFILIFFWSLKKSESLGYGLIFLAGLINDILVGFPIGMSCINYLLICGFAAYLRNMTLRPNLINDWIFFLVTLSIINSFHYSVLSIFFQIHLDYLQLISNTFFTFLFYFIFAYIFRFYLALVFGDKS